MRKLEEILNDPILCAQIPIAYELLWSNMSPTKLIGHHGNFFVEEILEDYIYALRREEKARIGGAKVQKQNFHPIITIDYIKRSIQHSIKSFKASNGIITKPNIGTFERQINAHTEMIEKAILEMVQDGSIVAYYVPSDGHHWRKGSDGKWSCSAPVVSRICKDNSTLLTFEDVKLITQHYHHWYFIFFSLTPVYE